MKVQKLQIRKARIEIIPMIDAIFFLLVFFMFSSLSMVRLAGSNVAVPAKSGAASATTSVRDTNIVVSVGPDGRTFVGREEVAQGTLTSALQGRLTSNPTAVVVVNMDKSRKAQNLISVIDSINAVALPQGKRPTILVATEPVAPQ